MGIAVARFFLQAECPSWCQPAERHWSMKTFGIAASTITHEERKNFSVCISCPTPVPKGIRSAVKLLEQDCYRQVAIDNVQWTVTKQ